MSHRVKRSDKEVREYTLHDIENKQTKTKSRVGVSKTASRGKLATIDSAVAKRRNPKAVRSASATGRDHPLAKNLLSKRAGSSSSQNLTSQTLI